MPSRSRTFAGLRRILKVREMIRAGLKKEGKGGTRMLEQAGSMFDDMAGMLSHIKKKVYKERMEYFREKNAQLLTDMVSFVETAENRHDIEEQEEAENRHDIEEREEAENRQEAAAQVAEAFADAVEARFAKRGKISGRSQMDLNLMMIYYVFPAILLTKSECAVTLADAVRDEWRGRFRDSEQLGYATYEEISASFKEKFLGIF